MITKTYDRISLSVKDSGGNVDVPANTSPVKQFLGTPACVGCSIADGIVSGFDHDAILLVVCGARSIDLTPTRVVVKVNDTPVGYSEGANGQPIFAVAKVSKGDVLCITADGAGNGTTLSANPAHSYLSIQEIDG